MKFTDAWKDTIWPTVGAIFEKWLEERPRKQDDGATGNHYGRSLPERAKHFGEVRGVCCNLAWVPPDANTPLQEDITYELVEAWAADNFLDPAMWNAKEQPDVVASADDGVDLDTMEGDTLLARTRDKKRIFKIPDMVKKVGHPDCGRCWARYVGDVGQDATVRRRHRGQRHVVGRGLGHPRQ